LPPHSVGHIKTVVKSSSSCLPDRAIKIYVTVGLVYPTFNVDLLMTDKLKFAKVSLSNISLSIAPKVILPNEIVMPCY